MLRVLVSSATPDLTPRRTHDRRAAEWVARRLAFQEVRMKPMSRLSLFLLPFLAAWSLSCAPEHPSGPGSLLSFDRSSAPGLDRACTDQPGEHLARRPNAPVEALCALTLPAGSKAILNGTKSWVDGGRPDETRVAKDCGGHRSP